MDEAFGDGDQQLNLDFTIPTLRERERERESSVTRFGENVPKC